MTCLDHINFEGNEISGAQLLMACLIAAQVDTIFGYPGGAVLHIYDALYGCPQIQHILTAHEQGAAHAADGYARASGKVGVCLATSGPGATNLITGIATAYLDSIPMVAITGNVPLSLLGKDSFQEVDITGMTMAVTKHNFIVKTAAELPTIIARAFHIASTGRPGPVLIDIPKNVTIEKLSWGPDRVKEAISIAYNQEVTSRPWRQKRQWTSLDKQTLSPILQLLLEAKKPVLYVGGGVIRAQAHREVLTFARAWGAAVVTSLMGLGAIASDHPQSMGFLGMHGSEASNHAVTECDVLVAVGTRFSDRVLGKLDAFAPAAQIIHLDIDPAEIGKNIRHYHSIVHPLSDSLACLSTHLSNHSPDPHQEEKAQWLETLKERYPRKSGAFRPQQILEAIRDCAGNQGILVTDVGQHQMWAAQYYGFSGPRQMITSGGLGTMGFGLGAAMGAQMAMPDHPVVLVTGDGCFHMNCNEIATAVRYNIPVKIFLFNNGVLGMVRQWQSLFCDQRYSQTTLDRKTNYEALAEAFGATAYTLGFDDSIESVVAKALTTEGPVLVNCLIEPDQFVLPMVPPGAGLSEMITEGVYYGKE